MVIALLSKNSLKSSVVLAIPLNAVLTAFSAFGGKILYVSGIFLSGVSSSWIMEPESFSITQTFAIAISSIIRIFFRCCFLSPCFITSTFVSSGYHSIEIVSDTFVALASRFLLFRLIVFLTYIEAKTLPVTTEKRSSEIPK